MINDFKDFCTWMYVVTMAFPKSRKRGSEQGKDLRKMSSKPASGLSSILKICLMDQSDDQIIYGCHDFASIANRHARGVFLERHIASVMQPGFNAPMSTPVC